MCVCHARYITIIIQYISGLTLHKRHNSVNLQNMRFHSWFNKIYWTSALVCRRQSCFVEIFPSLLGGMGSGLQFDSFTDIVTFMQLVVYVHNEEITDIVCSHYNDVIMGAIASQITSLTIAFSTVYSDADQRKHQSSASLACVRGIHRGLVNSPHKWPVTRKMFPFDDVIMARTLLVDSLPSVFLINMHFPL